MGFATRFVSLVGVASCAVMLAACGELFNARTQTADGSPASDANAANPTPSDANTATPGNTNTTTPGNTNGTMTGNTNTPTTTTPGNTNTPATTTPGNTNTPTATSSLALQNGCTQATVNYASGASTVINTSCAKSGCHGASGPYVNLSTYSAAKSGFAGRAEVRLEAGTMPPASSPQPTMAQKCVIYNWIDGGFAQ